MTDSTVHHRRWCGDHKMVWLRWADGHTKSNCDRPVWFGCESCGELSMGRCGSTNVEQCKPCGHAHRRRVGRIVCSGRYPGGTVFLLTLTAPTDAQHFKPNGEECDCSKEWAGRFDMADWNAQAGSCFNRFWQALRRATGQNLQYFKGTEPQQRGALHFHIPFRVERGLVVNVGMVRALAIAHGFGHSVDLQVVKDDGGLRYVAKYVSKGASLRATVPWRRVDAATGEVAQWPTYRTWSASRHWGQTMASVKAAQKAWWSGQQLGSSGAVAGAPAPEAAFNPSTPRYTSPVVQAPTASIDLPM
jgi:hypothetical protein